MIHDKIIAMCAIKYMHSHVILQLTSTAGFTRVQCSQLSRVACRPEHRLLRRLPTKISVHIVSDEFIH